MYQRRVQFVLCYGRADVPGRLDEGRYPVVKLGDDVCGRYPRPTRRGGRCSSWSEARRCRSWTTATPPDWAASCARAFTAGSPSPRAAGDPDLGRVHRAQRLPVEDVALAGRGIAWLPESLVADELRTRLLVPAGGDAWLVPIEVRLYRQSAEMAPTAEALWRGRRRRGQRSRRTGTAEPRTTGKDLIARGERDPKCMCRATVSCGPGSLHSIREDGWGGTDRTCMGRKRVFQVLDHRRSRAVATGHGSLQHRATRTGLETSERLEPDCRLVEPATGSADERLLAWLFLRRYVAGGGRRGQRANAAGAAAPWRKLSPCLGSIAQGGGAGVRLPSRMASVQHGSCPSECCSAGAAWGASDIGSTTLAHSPGGARARGETGQAWRMAISTTTYIAYVASRAVVIPESDRTTSRAHFSQSVCFLLMR